MGAGIERPNIKINSGEEVGIAIDITENGMALQPASLTWTLLDGDRNVINGRQDVPAVPGAPTVIDLAAADTTVSGADELRYLTIRASYSSQTLGNGVIRRQWVFLVKQLKEASS